MISLQLFFGKYSLQIFFDLSESESVWKNQIQMSESESEFVWKIQFQTHLWKKYVYIWIWICLKNSDSDVWIWIWICLNLNAFESDFFTPKIWSEYFQKNWREIATKKYLRKSVQKNLQRGIPREKTGKRNLYPKNVWRHFEQNTFDDDMC